MSSGGIPNDTPPAEVSTYRVPSESTPGVEYRVDVRDGEAVCDCPGFRTAGHCKHADNAKERTMVTEERIPEEGEERALATLEDGPPQALTVHVEQRSLPSLDELKVISTIAQSVVHAAGHAVPKTLDTPHKAAAVMLAGWELGLKPMTALRHVFVVNGRTEPDGSAMMGLVKAGDPTAEFIFHTYTNEACDVSLRRGGHLVARCEYTLEDAKRSKQLDKKRVQRDGKWIEIDGPWQLYARDMLAWSAVKRVCRLGAPDLINAIPSVDVRMAGAMLPEPIETVAIGESGRTLADERKSAEFVAKANQHGAGRPLEVSPSVRNASGAMKGSEQTARDVQREIEADRATDDALPQYTEADVEAHDAVCVRPWLHEGECLPRGTADDSAEGAPSESEPDPNQQTPEELAAIVAEEKRLAAETKQGEMLPPDPKTKAHA